MKQTLTRGFTLIELLVVIAIIGILASVVLASLNSAREKGADAAASSSLNNARAQAELAYDDDGDYAATCTNIAQFTDAADEAIAGQSVDCVDVAEGWAAGITLNSGEYYCVDSTGYGGEPATAPTLSDTNITCNP